MQEMLEWSRLCSLEDAFQQQQPCLLPFASVDEVCGLLLLDCDPRGETRCLLLRLSLLRRCFDALPAAGGTSNGPARTTGQTEVSAVCMRVWHDSRFAEAMMERLGSSDWWVALAARRALQAMLLHVSPTALALSRAAYQHMLDACYRSLLSAAASSGEGKSTASARLCTELMQSWRRRHEQQGKWVPCYTVGLRLLQSLMNALDALTAPSPSVDQGESHKGLGWLDGLFRLLTEALKCVRLESTLATDLDAQERREAEELRACLPRKIVAHCPKLIDSLYGWTRAEDRHCGEGIRTSSSLLRLLTHLLDDDTDATSSLFSSDSVLCCLRALDILVPFERDATLRLSLPPEPNLDDLELASLRAQLAQLISGDPPPLLPASCSGLLADGVTEPQLLVLRRRMVLLLMRVSAFCARLLSRSEASPSFREQTETVEVRRKRRRKDNGDPQSPSDHNDYASLSSRGHMDSSSSMATLKASLSKFLQTNIGREKAHPQPYGIRLIALIQQGWPTPSLRRRSLS